MSIKELSKIIEILKKDKEALKNKIQIFQKQKHSQKSIIEELRQGFEEISLMFPTPNDAHLEKVKAGNVPGEFIQAPNAVSKNNILYLHGGGYVTGSIKTHRNMAYQLSKTSKCRVLLIDYRLAPEHSFPAAIEDCITAYRWLISSGVKPSNTVIAGDSAGASLTISTMVAQKESGDVLPAAGLCISPWIDLEGKGESIKTKLNIDPLVFPEMLNTFSSLYLNGVDKCTALTAPLYADLKGLPPILIQVGSSEILLDDSILLQEKCQADGVNVDLKVWNNMFHVWHLYAPILSEAKDALIEAGKFIALQIERVN